MSHTRNETLKLQTQSMTGGSVNFAPYESIFNYLITTDYNIKDIFLAKHPKISINSILNLKSNTTF